MLEKNNVITSDEFCKGCSAWDGYDCRNNPYTEGCIRDPKNDEWLNSPDNPESKTAHV